MTLKLIKGIFFGFLRREYNLEGKIHMVFAHFGKIMVDIKTMRESE